jgi:diguanylate cyclase (GGDEF)-like protein
MKVYPLSFFHPQYLAHKMMRVVFSLYLIVTLLMTCIHFVVEYSRTQRDIVEELEILENTFHEALETNLWQMSDQQLKVLTEGLIAMPIITGVDIVSPEGEKIVTLQDFNSNKPPLWLFSIDKKLNWKLKNQIIPLGIVKLYSSSDVVFNRVFFGFMLIVLNAAIKIPLLWFLFLWAFRRFLATPLQELALQIDEINLDSISEKRIQLDSLDQNELLKLQQHFNGMLITIENDKRAMLLAEANRRAWLEQEIAARTKELKISNEKLLYLASTDTLTGISNRRVFFEQAQTQIDLALRHKTPLCLLSLDIDHFKKVNDTYGHFAGDQVLIQFANTITANLRNTDIFARIGGEEFAILLINTQLNDAIHLAETLRSLITEIKVHYQDQLITFSSSIGLCEHQLEDKTITDLFVRTDCLLYQAKQQGRNCVQY